MARRIPHSYSPSISHLQDRQFATDPCTKAAAARDAKRHCLMMTILVLCSCAIIYGWTLNFPFVFDDESYLTNNPIAQTADSFRYPWHFKEFATLPSRLHLDPDLATNFILRPAAYATFYANYKLSGFDPRWFRIVNIVIHAASAILVRSLVVQLLRRHPPASGADGYSTQFIAGSSALMFAVHPLATESVTYIIQRFTSLATFLYLSTLAVWFSASDSHDDRMFLWLRRAAVILLVIGMLTKEIAITAPLMVIIIDVFVRRTPLPEAIRDATPLLWCLPLIPTLVIAISIAQNPGSFDLRNSFNIVNSADTPVSHWDYLITQITVVAEYVRLIFWPSGLNIDPEWPVHHSLLDGPVVTALTSLIVCSGWTFLLWYRKPDDTRTRLAIAFGIWFLVTISVSSGIIPLPDVMSEHRTYLPSVGMFILAASLLDRARTHSPGSIKTRFIVPSVVAVCVIALGWAACDRNETWRTPRLLWMDTARKSKAKSRVWSNLGVACSREGDEKEAVVCFREAVRLNPQFRQGLFNLANSLLRLGAPSESLETCNKLLRLNQNKVRDPTVIYLAGLALADCGRLDEATRTFKDLLAINPFDARYHQALGITYLNTRNAALALTHFRIAAGLIPPNPDLQSLIQIADSAVLATAGVSGKLIPIKK